MDTNCSKPRGEKKKVEWSFEKRLSRSTYSEFVNEKEEEEDVECALSCIESIVRIVPPTMTIDPIIYGEELRKMIERQVRDKRGRRKGKKGFRWRW